MKEKTISYLFEKYNCFLFDFAFFRTNNKEVSEDLVQETFIIAVRKINTFRYESSHKTWLTAILKNKISDFYKKKLNIHYENKNNDLFRLDGPVYNKYSLEIFNESEKLLDNPKFVEDFYKSIDNLPKLWNSVIYMKYISPIKSKEICDKLEITDVYLWQIVHRSKKRMKEDLSKKWIIS